MRLDETEKVCRVLRAIIAAVGPTNAWEGYTMRTRLMECTGFARDEVMGAVGVLVRLGVISVQPAYGERGRGRHAIVQWRVLLPAARPVQVDGEWQLG